MTCPHCNHSFRLTWRRYARSPFGKHICPSCGLKSKFKLTVYYFLLVVVAWMIYEALAVGVTVLLFPKTWQGLIGISYGVIVFLIGSIVLIPLDKFFEERFRRLEQSEDGKIAEPCAAPNGGPATRVENSRVTEGPPSVS